MRLINSDGQVEDAKVTAEAGGVANRNEANASVRDYGNHIAALGFAIAAFCLSAANTLWLTGRTLSAEFETARVKAEASMQLGIEKRLNTQAIDELKLEMRQALRDAGKNPDTDYTHASK